MNGAPKPSSASWRVAHPLTLGCPIPARTLRMGGVRVPPRYTETIFGPRFIGARAATAAEIRQYEEVS